MNCKTCNELMMKHFDGNESILGNPQFEQHVRSCKTCGADFKNLSEIFSLLDMESNNIPEPPQDFEAEVIQKIKISGLAYPKKTDSFLVTVYSMASVCAVLLTVFLFAGIGQANVPGLEESFGSVSGAAAAVYNILKAVYSVLNAVKNSLSQLVVSIVETYDFVLLTLAGMYFTLQKAYGSLLSKQGGGGTVK